MSTRVCTFLNTPCVRNMGLFHGSNEQGKGNTARPIIARFGNVGPVNKRTCRHHDTGLPLGEKSGTFPFTVCRRHAYV